jgi:hypothetical protein
VRSQFFVDEPRRTSKRTCTASLFCPSTKQLIPYILLYQQQDAGITDYRYADRKKFGELRGDICAIRLVSTPSVTKKPPTITS